MKTLIDTEENEAVARVPDSATLESAVEAHLKHEGYWDDADYSIYGSGKSFFDSLEYIGCFRLDADIPSLTIPTIEPAPKAASHKTSAPIGVLTGPIMDEDDLRRDLTQLAQEQAKRIETLTYENDAWRVDSQMLSEIHNLLAEAMPGYKGPPSTPEWTVAAVGELIQHRNSLIAALKDTLPPLQDAQNQLHHVAAAAAYINAREIIRHTEPDFARGVS